MGERSATAEQAAGAIEGAEILRALDVLGDELGAQPLGNQPARAAGWLPASVAGEEDEALLNGLRERLERLADRSGRDPNVGDQVIDALLDGAHQLFRNEIITGRTGELRQLLPAFAYLVRSAIAGETEAQLAAARAAELLRC